MERTPVLIDCDPGVDDMFALLLALGSPSIQVVGVSIVMGNHENVEMLARNACLALHLAGHAAVPVAIGATAPIGVAYHGHSGIKVHGDDGLGHTGEAARVPDDFVRTCRELGSCGAGGLMSRLAEAHAGRLVVIALGPLTNVALAAEQDAAIVNRVAKLAVMGGTTDGRGNKTPAAEANFHNDAVAAKRVFAAFPRIVLAGLNATRQVSMLRNGFRERLRDVGNEAGRVLFAVSQHYCDLLKSWGNSDIPMHDPTAVMSIVHPELFKTETREVDVEAEKVLTEGAVVVDWMGHWGKKHVQTEILMEVDVAAYHERFVEAIARLG